MFIWNLAKREKVLLSICIILATIAIAYSLAIEPVIVHWKTLNNQIESKAILLIRNTKLLNMYKTLKEEYVQYRDFIKVSENEERELAKALGEMENISKKSSCYIANVKPRTSKKLGSYKEISFEVTAEGSINELSRFMYEIETSKEYLRIRRFIITSKSGPARRLKGTFLISKILFT